MKITNNNSSGKVCCSYNIHYSPFHCISWTNFPCKGQSSLLEWLFHLNFFSSFMLLLSLLLCFFLELKIMFCNYLEQQLSRLSLLYLPNDKGLKIPNLLWYKRLPDHILKSSKICFPRHLWINMSWMNANLQGQTHRYHCPTHYCLLLVLTRNNMVLD